MVGPGSDNSKPTDSTEHQSLLGAAKESTEKCFNAFIYEVGVSPLVSLHQFVNESTGKHLPDLEFTKPDSSMSSTVGSFIGDVAKFVILSKVVHSAFNPVESAALAETAAAASTTIRKNALESATVGTVAGFLTPVDKGRDYWTEKGSTMVTSGAAFGTMGGTAAALSKTAFLSSEAALTRTIAINGIAGLAGGTIDSAVDSKLHNQPITLDKTIKTAATYGLFGAAFGGVAHAVGVNSYVGRPESDAIKIKTEPGALDQVDDSIAKPTLREHAANAIRAVHTKTLEIGRSIDNSIAKINPLLALDNYPGMQLAYEGAGYHPTAQSARPYYSRATNPLVESRMLSVAHQTPEIRTKSPKIDFDQMRGPGNAAKPGETTRRLRPVNDVPIVLTDAKTEAQLKPADLKSKKVPAENVEAQHTTSEAKSETDESTDAKAKKTYDITSVLNTTERGREFLNVLDQLKEEHPSFLKGLRSSTSKALGGRDSVVIELADGKYKNAVLKFTTIFGDAKDTLTPTQWDSEWGHRPYDAPLLSPVHELELGGGDQGYVYVQEKGDGATHVDAFYDPNDDASFAKDKEDPDLAKIMEQLEERQEEFVDPGSRQLAWSAIKGRLVLIDYAAVMRSADIPPEWRTQTDAASAKDGEKAGAVTSRSNFSGNEHSDDAAEDVDEPAIQAREIRDASVEDLRYEFVRRAATTPEINVQNQIAEQLFAGETDQDIRPYIEIVCQDSLTQIGKNAKDAIKWTRQILKDQHLL
jgi:hypothetical protein